MFRFLALASLPLVSATCTYEFSDSPNWGICHSSGSNWGTKFSLADVNLLSMGTWSTTLNGGMYLTGTDTTHEKCGEICTELGETCISYTIGAVDTTYIGAGQSNGGCYFWKDSCDASAVNAYNYYKWYDKGSCSSPTCDTSKIETQYDGTFSGTSIVNTITSTPSSDNFWHGTTGAFDARKGNAYNDDYTDMGMQYFSMKFTTSSMNFMRAYVNIFSFNNHSPNKIAYVRYTRDKFMFCYATTSNTLSDRKREALRCDQSAHTCTDVIATGGDINNKQWIMTVLPDKISITSEDGTKG